MAKGQRRKTCRKCFSQRRRELHRQKRREEALEQTKVLAGTQCSMCGETHLSCLNLLLPDEIVVVQTADTAKILERLHEIIVVCHNCLAKALTLPDPQATLSSHPTLLESGSWLDLAEPVFDEPPVACNAPPGSPAKIAMMRWRAENGYPVEHPGDKKL